MNLRALRHALGAMFFALSLTVSLNLIFSPQASADDTLSDADKDFCIEMSGYRLKFDESPDEPGTKDGDLYRLGTEATKTVRLCLGAKFCTISEDNPALGSKITCEAEDETEEPPGSGDFPSVPSNIPTGAKPLLALMCNTYNSTMKQDCRGLVANVYTEYCYADKERIDKIDEWADCVWKTLTSKWDSFMKAYPDDANPVPNEAKIKEALLQGAEDSEDAIGEAESKKCREDGGTWDGEADECVQASSETSCAIDGIGWIICPVMNFLAEMNEKAFDFLQSLLGIRPSLVQDEGTVTAWEKFRDLANVAFVIAFMVIIYSQITSVGISNYGIKKLLPKIAIAAIMVNLSLFFCQILVDISNIAGASLYSFISGLVPAVEGTAGDSSWTNLMTGVLAAGVGVLLVALIVTAPTVLIALGMILLILVARQAFILILVIISPLAFVAYLLPNTESMFKKWWKALSATLLVYPIVAIVFGASTLASNILMGIASQEGNIDANSTDDNQMLAIVALAVMAVPLFAVPVILKSAMSGAGAIGQRLAGLQDKANAHAKNKAGEEAKFLGNRATSAMLGNNGKFAKTARGLTRSGARAARKARLDSAQKQREGVEDTYTHHTNTGSAARWRAAYASQAAGSAAKQATQHEGESEFLEDATKKALRDREITAKVKLEVDKNDDVSEHMEDAANRDLYLRQRGAGGRNKNAGLALDAAYEGTERGQRLGVERQGLEDTVAARQADQKRIYNQQQTTQLETTGQSLVQQRKVSEGQAKTAEQTNELVYLQSSDGKTNAQELMAVEGDIEIEHGEEKNVFEDSDVGKTQAQSKKVVQGEGKLIEDAAQLAYEVSDDGKEIEKAKLSLQSEIGTEQTKTKTDFTKSKRGKALNLDSSVAQAQLGAVEAANKAQVDELKAGAEAAGVVGTSLEQVANDLSAADLQTRAQTQRSASGTRKANSEYATAVGNDTIIPGGTETLATIAGGIQGEAGVIQAKAVAHQTMLDDWKKNVEANETLLSEVKEDQLLGDPDKEGNIRPGNLNDPDALDLPDEQLSSMASVIAQRSHMKSHIRLWKRMGELHKQASDERARASTPEEVAAADERLSKVKNMEQIVMAKKSKKPFGVSDQNQGDAVSGDYDDNIFDTTRERLMTNVSPKDLSTTDPDDFILWYEMDRKGFLTDAQRDNLIAGWEAWKISDQHKDSIQNKTRNVMERMKKHADTGVWDTGELNGLKDPGQPYDLTADDFDRL